MARTEEQCASVYMPEITNHFFFTYRNVKNRRAFIIESVAPYTKKGEPCRNSNKPPPPKSIVRTIAIWGVYWLLLRLFISEKHFGAKFKIRVRISSLNWLKDILNFHLVHTAILDMSVFQWPISIFVTLSGKVKWLYLTYLPRFRVSIVQI